ncbi:hypothetical protein [Ensifer sp. LC163]|uniref:hypothetical protein n=1 Tax=Ensifer sp. LC163 TaxID=1120652 RepID=UPI00081354B6|nr:hypothetical protein [Ensifer sp. LC163]OCP36218.1 hypothetical protein BC360_25230 [Ensifer sp. LC163]
MTTETNTQPNPRETQSSLAAHLAERATRIVDLMRSINDIARLNAGIRSLLPDPTSPPQGVAGSFARLRQRIGQGVDRWRLTENDGNGLTPPARRSFWPLDGL